MAAETHRARPPLNVSGNDCSPILPAFGVLRFEPLELLAAGLTPKAGAGLFWGVGKHGDDAAAAFRTFGPFAHLRFLLK